MKRLTPRIIKTVRSSNNIRRPVQTNQETNIYEKKTVNKTHTISRTNFSNNNRPIRKSNQIIVSRRVEAQRPYTPIKRVHSNLGNNSNLKPMKISSQRHSEMHKNAYQSKTGKKSKKRISIASKTPNKISYVNSMQNSKNINNYILIELILMIF
jgi:hypothetical protein